MTNIERSGDKGVAISSFRVNVDEMALLRTPRQDEDGLMEITVGNPFECGGICAEAYDQY